MTTLTERIIPLQEHDVETQQSKLMSFLLWLLMTELTIDADETAHVDLQTFATQHPDEAILYSVAPHTGHPDSLMVYKAIEKINPSVLPHLRFVSAKDTWSSKFSKVILKATIGNPYLFDRQNLTIASMKTQVAEMAQLLNPEQESGQHADSLVIYPQGTRTIGAPIENMPAVLAHEANVPIAVLNIYDAETVMPKAAEGQQASQIIRILIERLRTRRAKHPVTIKLVDFIPPGGNRKETKERFQAAHQEPLSTQ